MVLEWRDLVAGIVSGEGDEKWSCENERERVVHAIVMTFVGEEVDAYQFFVMIYKSKWGFWFLIENRCNIGKCEWGEKLAVLYWNMNVKYECNLISAEKWNGVMQYIHILYECV